MKNKEVYVVRVYRKRIGNKPVAAYAPVRVNILSGSFHVSEEFEKENTHLQRKFPKMAKKNV